MEKEELESLIEQVIKKTLQEVRTAEDNKKRGSAYKMTFTYLKEYNNMVSSLQNEAPDSENDMIQAVRESKQETSIILENLKRALEELRKEQEEKGQLQKYEVLEMYFFKGYTYEQILDRMPMGDSTPRRWVSEMVNKMSVKLFGASAIHDRNCGQHFNAMKKM